MASRMGVAVLSVTHLSKGGGSSANSRIIGSIAFVAQARAAFIVARDPADKDRRLFLSTKNNLGPDGGGIGFRIGQVETPSGLLAPTIFWDTMPVTMSAEEVLGSAADHGSAPARNEAEDFLRDMLADGQMPTEQSRMRPGKQGWRGVQYAGRRKARRRVRARPATQASGSGRCRKVATL